MTDTVILPPIDATPEAIAKPLLPPPQAQADDPVRAKQERNAGWVNNPMIPG